MIDNSLQIKEGTFLSESSHYIVLGFKQSNSNIAIVKHLESGETIQISAGYLYKHTFSGDLFDKVVTVGKEDKKDGTAGIKTIWDSISSMHAFTVCFTKQDKPKIKKAIAAEKDVQFNTALNIAKNESIEKALRYMQEHPVNNIVKGEDRILRGYKIQFTSKDGLYDCVDVDIEEEHNIRKVNIRTIKWIIYNGVKYVVE